MTHDTSLGLSGHQERDRAGADEANGNGRTGFLMKLTVKQVSIILGIFTTLAAASVAVLTRDPAKADPVRASGIRAEASLSNEVLEKALDASPKYQLDQRRVDELAKVVEAMSGQVKFLYDEALKRQGAQEERQRRRKETQ